MQGTNKQSVQTKWISIGSITSEEAALDVDERDVATAEALSSTKIVQIQPAGNVYAMLLRFRSDGSENDDSVLQMYAARGNDHYHRIAQLTVVQGTQDTDTATIHFVDTITPASEDALFGGEESNLADMIAHYYVRTLGFDKFLFVCSDLDSTTVYIDVAYLYE
jgi:hypothetical protein